MHCIFIRDILLGSKLIYSFINISFLTLPGVDHQGSTEPQRQQPISSSAQQPGSSGLTGLSNPGEVESNEQNNRFVVLVKYLCVHSIVYKWKFHMNIEENDEQKYSFSFHFPDYTIFL